MNKIISYIYIYIYQGGGLLKQFISKQKEVYELLISSALPRRYAYE